MVRDVRNSLICCYNVATFPLNCFLSLYIALWRTSIEKNMLTINRALFFKNSEIVNFKISVNLIMLQLYLKNWSNFKF